MLQNKQENKQENKRLYITLCVVISLTIIAFTFLFLVVENFTLALTHSLLGLLLALVAIQVFHTRNHEKFNLLLSITYMGSLLAVLHHKGPEFIFWVYSAVAVTYFLLPLKKALSINITTVIATVPVLLPQISMVNFFNLYATIVLVGVVGYLLVIRTEQYKDRMMKQATEDELTGLKNKKSLHEKLSEIVANHFRLRQKSCVIAVDLDHFKKINKVYGYKTGDMLMTKVANTIQNKLRITDNIYRLEGDKFVIIAFNTTLKGAGYLAESIRDHIEHTEIFTKYNITLSLGVTHISITDNGKSWLERAQEALQKAKETGGNTSYLAIPDNSAHGYLYSPPFINDSIEHMQYGSTVTSLQSFKIKNLLKAD